MRISRYPRRLLFSIVVLIAMLSISWSAFSPNVSAHTNSTKKGWSIAELFGVRPLWKYAQKISFNSVSQGQIPPCLISAVPPRCFSPQQIRRAYNIQKLLKAGITGKGRTIVLIDGSTSPTLTADVHLYDTLYGLKDPKINVIAPFGIPAFDPNAYIETALDVEISHAIAPDATIDLVLGDTSQAQSPGDFDAILLRVTKYAVDNDLGDVISQSFGVGESCVGSAYLQAEQHVFQEARLKRITVLASAGDDGDLAVSCSGSQITLAKGVSVPAADPLATSVGGTTLNADVKTGQYESETTWNEWNNGSGATGGGFSTVFARPSYQNGVRGIGAFRGVPDVAFVADPLTGVPVVVSAFGETLIIPVGGTSVGSPAWAAIVALANQAAGERLGFLNGSIYRLMASDNYSQGFNDITTGDNTTTTFDNNGNPVTVPGYSAGIGWDAVTGAGTPRVSSLVSLLGG
ncbi:MAG TPA: S53 family peptidase [Ktedonobacteraceae bacterium]|nr:S53 family peptidase [Ktedonobacteraceae bacterium]